MKRWYRVSGFLLVLLVCQLPLLVSAQSEDSVQDRVGGGQSPYLSFCQERFYEEDDGLIRCNWAVNFNYACFVSYPSNKVIQAGSKISEPEVVGECDNGERIIKILHY
ncbi:hypothetical protein PVT68_00825 [Microbulbifer bruguierae]|uniref:Uncharacterized protein n=1 Tax=Microbulbifer bruguierae TaxID=3029061 RepID=A0ABY8ND58_9GAMM|nr:hypothetical protein [Microbulbifer bruguierae]WGL16856.1 hypothetical protein PVT68_00825 [Microbulbifer bruguierae]